MNKGPVSIAAAMVLASICGGSLSAASPPKGGTISIEARTAGADDPSMRSFVIAAGEALGAKGFTILTEPGHAAYVAELTLTRVDLGTSKAKALTGSSSSITPGAVPGAVGAGATVPLATGKSRLVALQRIRLEIRIRKLGEDSTLWDGAALTVRAAGTRKGADEIVAADLSEAVLRSYPAETGDVIGVP
jgi:hypothetical protein